MRKKLLQQDQAALLRRGRDILGKTTAELADSLGVSEPTVIAWLAPKTAAKHRTMPKGSKLLLERLIADEKAKRAGKAE